MPNNQSIDELAAQLRAEGKLDDKKYQAVKLALKQQLNLWIILIALGIGISFYLKHPTLRNVISTVVLATAGPLYLIQQRKIYARTAFLYNFGFIEKCKVTKIILFHPAVTTHWKVAGEYKNKSGANVSCKFTVPKKSNPTLAVGDLLEILCSPEAQEATDVVYFDNLAKVGFDMRKNDN